VSVTFRIYTDDDLPAIKALWRDAGWGDIDDATWSSHTESPLGTMIAIAEDVSGDVVGQLMFERTRVSVDGRELKAARPGAAAVAPSARGIASFAMITRLYRFGVARLREEGVSLLHMLPAFVGRPRVRPGVQHGRFPVWSRPLPLDRPAGLPPGFTVHELERSNGEVDRLGKRWSAVTGCSRVRDSATLEWKIRSGDYALTAVARDGSLAGLAAWEHTDDENEPFICDVLAEDGDDALRATLAAATNAVDAHTRRQNLPFEKVCVLAPPMLEPAVADLGFSRDAFDFPIVIHVVDPGLDEARVSPDRWYVSAND
jgi:hypothetical protein